MLSQLRRVYHGPFTRDGGYEGFDDILTQRDISPPLATVRGRPGGLDGWSGGDASTEEFTER